MYLCHSQRKTVEPQQYLAGDENAFLYSGVFSQGENAMAYYHYVSNGEVFEGSTQVTLRGINDQGLLEADGYPTGVLYPVSLINGQNQIIGILLGDNLCLPVGQSADVIGAVVLVLLMDCNSTSGTFLKPETPGKADTHGAGCRSGRR